MDGIGFRPPEQAGHLLKDPDMMMDRLSTKCSMGPLKNEI